MTQPPLTAADLDAMSPNDGEVAVSDLTPERRAAIRGWAGHQVVASEQLALLDALEAAEARATTAERDKLRGLLEDLGRDLLDVTAERDALQAQKDATLAALSSPHASLRRIAEARRALTDPPKAEPETGEQP